MLFKDNFQLPNYTAFPSGVEYYSIIPTLRMIEQDHLVKLLGNEQYSDLDSALQLITNETSLSMANQLLLHHCRMVIGPYLMFYYTPKAEITVSASGARRSETNEEKTAFQYQVTNFQEVHLREAEKASEILLQFLETNKSNYSLWLNSSAFAKYKSLFINTAESFDDCYKTASPYRNYWAMRWKMYDVEMLHIRPKLGTATFNDLKAKWANPSYTLSDFESELIGYIKKAIAYFTIAFSLPDISARLDENGLSVVGLLKNSNDKDNRQYIPPTQLGNIIHNAHSSAVEWLNVAYDFLLTNNSNFPNYTPPTPPTENQAPKNDALTASFGLV